MKPKIPTKFDNGSASCHPADSFEETLHLLAHAPVPEGLTERVQSALHNPPQAGRLLVWPTRPVLENGWMRAAAAAAIVFVVAGGGWGVYSRVQPGGLSKSVVAPARAIAPGRFSSAGAVRTPQTLNGPVLTRPADIAPQSVQKVSGAPKKGSRPALTKPKAKSTQTR